jgi:phosphopantetheinyl transferase
MDVKFNNITEYQLSVFDFEVNHKVDKQINNNAYLLICNIKEFKYSKSDIYEVLPEAEVELYFDNTGGVLNPSLCSRFLLYRFLSKHCGIDAKMLVMSKNRSGKPYFSDGIADFSISHSGDFVIVAVSFSGAVGVDFEHKISKNKDVKRISKRFFHMDEFLFLDRKNEVESQESFTKMWIKKEAIVKCFGATMFSSMSRINTLNNLIEVSDNEVYKDVFLSMIRHSKLPFDVCLASESEFDNIYVFGD